MTLLVLPSLKMAEESEYPVCIWLHWFTFRACCLLFKTAITLLNAASFQGAENAPDKHFSKACQHSLQLDLSRPQQCILSAIAQHCEKFDTDMIVASQQEADYALAYAYKNPMIAVAIHMPALQTIDLGTLPARAQVWVYLDARHPAYTALKNRYRMMTSEQEFEQEVARLAHSLYQLP